MSRFPAFWPGLNSFVFRFWDVQPGLNSFLKVPGCSSRFKQFNVSLIFFVNSRCLFTVLTVLYPARPSLNHVLCPESRLFCPVWNVCVQVLPAVWFDSHRLCLQNSGSFARFRKFFLSKYTADFEQFVSRILAVQPCLKHSCPGYRLFGPVKTVYVQMFNTV